MFSVVFPGQGSQMVRMGKEFFDKHDQVKKFFKDADDILGVSLTKIIFDGPKDQLDLTINTQPAIFLVSYSIFNVLKNEYNIDLDKAEYFAGHSLGEYSALSASGSIDFNSALKLLQKRGKSMQSAVPKGEGGMLAILGETIENINEILINNKDKYECYIANDNSNGQIVVSGKNNDLESLTEELKKKSIKNIKLAVSAPFHCKLMNPATQIMQKEIFNTEFKDSNNLIISNVTSKEMQKSGDIKDLLVKQIESPVRWRESIIYMINNNVKNFVEIGPGKILSGMIKRIDRNVNIVSVNELDDIKNISFND